MLSDVPIGLFRIVMRLNDGGDAEMIAGAEKFLEAAQFFGVIVSAQVARYDQYGPGFFDGSQEQFGNDGAACVGIR